MFKYLMLAMQLLPTILNLMTKAEEAGKDGKWTGEEKKGMVLEGAKAALETVTGVSTGGQKETWERINPAVGNIVDNLAEIVFPKEKQ